MDSIGGPWAVFMDRDGVVTEAVIVDGVAGSPLSVAEMRVVGSASAAVSLLKHAGALVIVVTNQPDVGRGRLSVAELEVMHEQLRRDLAVDEVLVCPHTGNPPCECRKPRPGLLRDAMRRYGMDPRSCWMVGDRWVDVAAGAAAGVRTVLIEAEYSWKETSAGSPSSDLRPDCRVATIWDAAEAIVRTSKLRPPGPVAVEPSLALEDRQTDERQDIC